MGVGVERREEVSDILRALHDAGFEARDLSDNEMAKLHVRHLVGGRAQGVHDERLCRFEFPERPGALLRFLETMGRNWNISLFHYRNHGTDYGRVLVGLQIPAGDEAEYGAFLERLGSPYADESGNPTYRLFLA